MQLAILLAVLDPGLALTLRIDEEREARRFRHDDTVLNGQLVVGQTLQVPLANLDNNKILIIIISAKASEYALKI